MLRTVLSDKRKDKRSDTRDGKPQRGRRAHRVDTRDQILDAADALLRGRGYNAFSYKHIAVQLGIRNAAIHYHFPSKEDLGRSLIERYRERFRAWAELLEQDSLGSWALLQAYFSVCRDYLDGDGKVCPGGILTTEYDSIPESMRSEVQLMMREIYSWLITVLGQGQSDGSLRFIGDAEDKAQQIGASLQGALQISRLAGADHFHRVVKQFERELRP